MTGTFYLGTTLNFILEDCIIRNQLPRILTIRIIEQGSLRDKKVLTTALTLLAEYKYYIQKPEWNKVTKRQTHFGTRAAALLFCPYFHYLQNVAILVLDTRLLLVFQVYILYVLKWIQGEAFL